MERRDKKNKPSEDTASSLTIMTKELIDQIVEKNPPIPPPGSLSTTEQLKERQKQELAQIFNPHLVQHRINNAWRILKDFHVSFVDPKQSAAREAFIRQMSSQFQSGGPQPNYTFDEILCIPKEKIDASYDVGKELFEKKYFADACDVFFLLTQLNPYYANIWIAMGLCWQNQHNFDAALGSFAVAILLNEKNPEPYLSSIECYLSLKDKEHARETIDLVRPIIEKQSENGVYRQRLAHLLQESK